ncbi:hypothetical protein C7S13_3616 [Burkholderia cepacia]|nr:hypothetical protein WI27_21440 [Burkholderia cepacia]MDW9242969.1 hypothetical protein [Burkholderia cepacia]
MRQSRATEVIGNTFRAQASGMKIIKLWLACGQSVANRQFGIFWYEWIRENGFVDPLLASQLFVVQLLNIVRLYFEHFHRYASLNH